jgi:acetolactate synthase-1/2/3 large subunit
MRSYNPVVKGHSGQIRKAISLLQEAQRPYIYTGGGVILADAAPELKEFADLLGYPVTNTLMGLGGFPGTSPQFVGMLGMHGTYEANMAMQHSDVLIAIGARFDDRVIGNTAHFASHPRKIIHIDIDPSVISKRVKVDVPIVGNLKEVLQEMTAQLKAGGPRTNDAKLAAWWAQINEWRKKDCLKYDEASQIVKPQYVVQKLWELTGGDAFITSDVGQHQMWAAQFISYENPRTWLNSGGLGTMGYAVPAAMGAKVGAPDTTVWAIDGDGCFQMTNQELVTCALNNIPVKIAIINNESLGMVRQWQTLFYEGRYSNTSLDSKRVPNFPMLAEAMGCVGLSCERPEDVDATIEKAMSINDQPVVVDFRVHRDAMVWPMVAAGTSNDDIMIARETAPDWDSQEL